MSSRKKNLICVIWESGRLKGRHSWLPEERALHEIEEGNASEFDPETREQSEPEPEEAISDIPDDFPARHHFIEAEVYAFDEVKELAKDDELKTVPGIGESTEHKINVYLEDN